MNLVDPVPLESPACPDPDDDVVHGTAVAGGCECIVSGNRDLRDLEQFRGIWILSPGDYWSYEASRESAFGRGRPSDGRDRRLTGRCDSDGCAATKAASAAQRAERVMEIFSPEQRGSARVEAGGVERAPGTSTSCRTPTGRARNRVTAWSTLLAATRTPSSTHHVIIHSAPHASRE
jgi:hypothetical protein